MSVGTGYGLDFSDALQYAEKLEKKLKDMVSHSETLQENITKAFSGGGSASLMSILGKLQDKMNKIGNTTVSPNFDTEKADKIYDVMVNIVDFMHQLGQEQKVELFNTDGVYDTNKNLLVVEENLKRIQKEIEETKEKWKDLNKDEYREREYVAEKFVAPTKEDGTKWSRNSKAYKAAYSEWKDKQRLEEEEWAKNQKRLKDEFDQTKQNLLAKYELEINALIEMERIAKEELKLAKMTADERLEYQQKALEKKLRLEQKHIAAVKKEYKALVAEEFDILNKMQRLDSSNIGDEGSEAKKEYERQLMVRHDRRVKLEQEYGAYVYNIAEQAQRKVLDMQVATIKERIKREEEAYKSSTQGALELAGSASTIKEMEEAQKYLKIARANTDVGDTKTIGQLNDAYTRLRATIEALTTAEKNENALQPTLRNEYARLLNEIDRLTDAKAKMEKTEAFREGDVRTMENYNAILSRISDAEKKKQQIQEAATPSLREKVELEKELAEWTKIRIELGKKAGPKDISDARKGGGTSVAQDYLYAEEQVKQLTERLKAVKQTESLVDDIVRKHAAERAEKELAETIKLEKAKKAEREKYEKEYGEFTRMQVYEAIDSANEAKNIAQHEKAIRELTEAKKHLSQEDDYYGEILEDIDAQITAHTHVVKLATDATYAAAEAQKKEIARAGGIVNYSKKETHSIEERRNAIKLLKQAIEELNQKQSGLSNSQYMGRIKEMTKELRRQENAIKSLTGETKKQIDAMDAVKRLAVTWFSLSTIKNYIAKLGRVRGEFELQQKSLQNLLQNKDKANEVWEKTVALAVKSPFTTQQLVTQTKQLAAYRIEADKLYDTNKMLADISTGIGVDMDRLILAYGQVKAANFLRGTELRQFSEAGVNVLGELVERFTELEGRAVSVGEVFERVSKRMVTFKDVEAVLQKMTGESGAFYKMQEKQSDTLKGMYLNLQDSIDLMLNDIGKSHEDILKGSIQIAKQLVDNWRALKPIVVSVTASIATAFAVHKVVEFVNVVQKAYVAISALGTAMKFVMAGTGIGLLVTVVGSLVYALTQATGESKKLKAAMKEIHNEGEKDLGDSIVMYKQLAKATSDVTTSIKDRNDAYEKLKAKFKDILPDELLARDYVVGTADGYKKAEAAMISYYNAKIIAQKRDKAETIFGESIDKEKDKIIKTMQETMDVYRKSIFAFEQMSEHDFNVLSRNIPYIVNSAVEDAKQGLIQFSAISETIQKRIVAAAKEHGDLMKQYAKGLVASGKYFPDRELKNLTNALDERDDALKSIEGLGYASAEQHDAARLKANLNEEFSAFKNHYSKLAELFKQYASATTDKDKGIYSSSISTELEKTKKMFPQYIGLIQRLHDDLYNAAEDGAYALSVAIGDISASMFTGSGGFAEVVSKINIGDEAADSLIKNFEEELNKEGQKLNLSTLQKGIISAFDFAIKEAKLTGKQKDIFATLIPDSQQTTAEVKQNVESVINMYKEIQKAYDTAKSAGGENLSFVEFIDSDKAKQAIPALDAIFQTTLKTLAENKKLIPVLERVVNLLGGSDKKTKNWKTSNIYDDQIKVIKDMHKKYKEVEAKFGKSEGIEAAFKGFKDAFAKAYKRPDVKEMSAEQFMQNVLNFPNTDAIIKWFDDLSKNVKDQEEKTRILLAKDDFEYDIKIKQKEESNAQILKSIEEMFGNYEIGFELDKLNIPRDLAEKLFGVSPISLDEIRSNIENELKNVNAAGISGDFKKNLEQQLKQVNELSRKQTEEEAKEFVKFLKNHLDEIQTIQRKGAQNISIADRLFGEGKLSAEQYSVAIQQIVSEINQEVSKINLDKFKESPQYIQAMGDLTAYTAKELEELINTLEAVVAANASAFGAEEAKAYTDAIYNAREQLDEIKKSPFRWDNIADVVEILETQRLIEEEKEKKLALQEEEKKQLEELALLNQRLVQLEIQKKQVAAGSVEDMYIDAEISATQQAIVEGEKAVKKTQNQGKAVETIIGKLGDKMRKLTGGSKTSFAVIEKIVHEINSAFQGLSDITNEIGSVLDSFGKKTDMSTGFGKLQAGLGIVAESSQHATDAFDAFMRGDPIGTVVGVVKTVSSIITGINKFKDAKIQVEIEEQAKKIERLQKAYEKLKEDIEEAYTIDSLKSKSNRALQNLDEQIKSRERQIELEREKKKTDAKEIEKYNEEIEALNKEREEFIRQNIENMDGTYDFKSVTRDFVDAWADAFNETGNGLKGLDTSFNDFWTNIVRNQVVMGGASKLLEGVLNKVNSSLVDYAIDEGEKSDIEQEWAKTKERMNAYLKDSADIWGDAFLGTDGDGALSGLQKGIQGVSEDTANIIAGYLNSLRSILMEQKSFVADISVKVGNSDFFNPVVDQLKSVIDQTTSIRQLLESVYSTEGIGGARLRVSID